MSVTLAIDIGNTRVKTGRFAEGELRDLTNHSHPEFIQMVQNAGTLSKFLESVQYIGYVSVGNSEMKAAVRKLVAHRPEIRSLEIDYMTALPVKNEYGSPETLGMDRVCSAVGAWSRTGTGPLLVIDAGTAITYDYIDAAGTYRGGGIAPGIRLRFRALDEFTAALPLVEKEGPCDLVGDDTVTSIRSGVVNGTVEEIRGIVSRYRELSGFDLPVFLTGGDAEFLGNHLKNINFVDSNLLLYGVQAIIQHNNSHA